MSDNITEESQHKTEARRPSWAWLGISFSMVISIVLALGFYFTYIHLNTAQVQFSKAVMDLDNIVTQNQNDLSALQNTIGDIKKTLQQTQDVLNSQQKIIDQLHHTNNDTEETLVIAESQRLVNAANDNLLMNSDTVLAIKLLKIADKSISQLKNPKLASISKALASDIAALQNVPTIDTSALYLRLSALNQQISQLPLISNKTTDEKNQSQTLDQAHKTWWQRGLAQTWQVLREIIIVRYHQPGERPFVLPDQQDFLYQNIHALFSQAMSAIAHKQPDIYRVSLMQASVWIKQYFAAQAPATAAMLASLAELQAINISPDLPNLSASLSAFHDYMDSSTESSTEE